MKIITKNPIIENGKRISPSDYWHQADGDNYLPFNGENKSNLNSIVDEVTGEEYFYNANGDDPVVYDKKGKKVKNFFGNIWKGLKAIGHAFVVAERWVVHEPNKIANKVRKLEGKEEVPFGAKRLKRVKAKEQKKKDKETADYMKKIMAENQVEGEKKGLTQAEIDAKNAKALADQEKANDENAKDFFQMELKPLTSEQVAKEKPEDIAEVDGKKYSTNGVSKDKPITLSTDQNGKKSVVVEHSTDEVVATKGANGEVEYVLKKDVEGMSKTLKYGLIIGGAVLLIGLGIYLYKKKK